MKTFLKLMLFTAIALVAVCQTASIYAGEPPELNDGDLIFQTTTTPDAPAIAVGSDSRLTHVGIIKNTPHGVMVIHAGSTVREMPLNQFINKGLFYRYEIYRYRNLKPRFAAKIIKSAEKLEGKPYDYFFSFENDEIYCSELIWLAYRAGGIDIGKVETIRELNIDNFIVKNLIRTRWRGDPLCKDKFDFESCMIAINEQELVTPVSLARDVNMELIYSNYPF